MFTVKVRDEGKGTEVLFDAIQVVHYFERREAAEGRPATFVGEVRCDATTARGIETITHPVRGCAPADGSQDITMYVMNRNGSTVAKYHL